MAILSKGPGKGGKKKDQPKSKIGSKNGQTVAAPGYKMTLVRKQGEPATRTNTIAGSPVGTKVKTPVGVFAPMPVAPAKKVPKRGYNLATGAPRKSAVGQALSDAKDSISYAVGQVGYNLRPSVQKRATFKGGGGGGRRKGGKTCPAY
jgi:hypothetical protein